MFIISIFLVDIVPVYAEDASFYEGEYIDNIYMNKYQYSTNTIYYQKARFFRKSDTGEFAYCIEPFNFFNDYAPYESTINPNNLSSYQIDRISKIAHFGYGYSNHTDSKWYAITQMMIWKTADPNSGDYYFTDSLNGNRVDYYTGEMNEIEALIANYEIIPSINNQTYTIVEDQELTINDTNQVLNNYHSNDLTINNNSITINNLKEGEYNYNLSRQDNFYNKPLIFYQSYSSQNLVKTGDLNDINISFKIKVIKTKIDITKIDKDNQSITPRGDAFLDGAIYELYDQDMNKLKELTIKNNQAILNNILFGTYYLKELSPGKGYTLDNNTYEIIISEDHPNKELILENKVIEKEIIIDKEYGEDNNFNKEKNIDFDIINSKGDIVKTVTTNDYGIARFILPYGQYQIKQLNSTKGYYKTGPIYLDVLDNETKKIELKDYKIPVPNTHTDNNFLFIIFMILLLC